MARIRTGGLAAQLSGSIAGVTFSHNRYGAYTRNRSIPTNPGTAYQLAQRNLMAYVSGLWKSLTDAQRESWRVWALTNPVMDPFGDSQILSGQAAHNKLNCRLKYHSDTVISVPPTTGSPTALGSITLSTDIGAGNFQVAYTPTPCAAGVGVWFWGCLVNSDGIRFVKNKLVLFHKDGGGSTSPVDIQTAATTRFGTLTVGATFHVLVHTIDVASGLISTPLIDSSKIVTT